MSWREALFSWQGRVSRGQCLFGIMATSFVWAIGSMLLLTIIAPGRHGFVPSPGTDAVIYATSIIALIPQVSLLVRRTHDIGMSGYSLLIFAVPLGTFIVARFIDPSLYGSWIETVIGVFYTGGMLIVLFAPGQREANRFGPPPLPGWLP